MTSTERIVNPVSVNFTDRADKGWVELFDGHTETSYNLEDYDVKVVVELTKRDKPIPTETVVKLDELTGHYIKMQSGWWWLGGTTPQRADNQNDAWYRKYAVPMNKGSWD